jgi:hypothetical protein
MAVAWLFSVMLAGVRPAWADAPEYLLGELGVRLDLPGSTWRMTRWSDWDFTGESMDGALLLFAWATPIQTPVTAAEGWIPVHLSKIEELQGTDPSVTGSQRVDIGGRSVALVEATFGLGKSGARGVAHGASLEIAGHDFHVLTVAPERLARLAESERRGVLERLDVRSPPTEVKFGGPITAAHVQTVLPPDFREPLPAESDAISEVVSQLPITDLQGCFIAIRPVPAVAPDILVGCPERGIELGVVDEHSFAAVDEAVRSRTFGARTEIPPAESIQLYDRMGLLFAPREGLALGVVGHDQGVTRFWALGQPEGDLAEAVRITMRNATFSGPHRVRFGQQASYWLNHRNTSPMVLVPALSCVLLAVLAAWGLATLALRPRRSRAHDEHTA